MNLRLHQNLKSQKFKTVTADNPPGFTMVDILVGLGMASVIMVIVIGIFTTMGKSFTTQSVAADAQQIARAGVDLMVQEIRMAGLDPTGSAGAGIVQDFDDESRFDEGHHDKVAPTDATHFAFTIDADMDGRIDHCRSVDTSIGCEAPDDNVENELIAFQINKGALERYRGGSTNWEDLTQNNVSNLSFTYYDETGTVTSAVNAIRTVEISMTVQLPAGRGGTVSRTYSTRVRCRNVGL